jgi:hypothetical protein
MANVNGAFGFRPLRHKTGGAIRNSEYTIASGYNADIFLGDPVVMTGTGRNISVSVGGTTNSQGVFAGVRYVDSEGRQKFTKRWTANLTATDIYALVWDDPDIVFLIQADTMAAGDIGALADWDDGTGNTKTGLSGRQVVASSTGTTGKSLRLMRLYPVPDNAYGAYAKAEVLFIEHALRGVVAGVGGV